MLCVSKVACSAVRRRKRRVRSSMIEETPSVERFSLASCDMETYCVIHGQNICHIPAMAEEAKSSRPNVRR